ncbi:hypothetical protein ABVT39_009386 [Epinephelus coioides]
MLSWIPTLSQEKKKKGDKEEDDDDDDDDDEEEEVVVKKTEEIKDVATHCGCETTKTGTINNYLHALFCSVEICYS